MKFELVLFDNFSSKYFFNNFSVYIVSSGIMSDEVSLNLKILSGKNSPQLVLLAHIDEENEFIWFRGILTNNDLSNLSNKKRSQEQKQQFTIKL